MRWTEPVRKPSLMARLPYDFSDLSDFFLTIFRVLAAALLFAASGLRAQAPRYAAAQLDSARFHQVIRTSIRSQTGGKTSLEQAGRDALLDFRATPGDTAIALVAWFDSLSLWRVAGGERYAPDTDGLIGGRYRGALTPFGRYTAEDTPFIPAPLAELAELRGVIGDFFPPLPSGDLAPGATVHLAGGWTMTRRSDSVEAGGHLLRYRLDGVRHRKQSGLINDSLHVEAGTDETEQGAVTWSPARGLLRWERRIQIDVNLPAQPGVTRASRTAMEQYVIVERVE